MSDIVLTNARLILETEVVSGTVAFGPDGIRDVAQGRSALPGAVDAGGDYLAPGLIEMHTDNLERHFMPRPKVFWPDGLAAAIAHDAQMAASGVTTVYDAIAAGVVDKGKQHRVELFERMIAAVEHGGRVGAFRIEHRLHLRCELTHPNLLAEVEPYAGRPSLGLVSLMDHTPGQRQFRDVALLKNFARSDGDRSEAEIDADFEHRVAEGPPNVAANWPGIVALFARRGVPIASHDDTTPEHVALAAAAGCTISEFPTTLEAAREARARGLATVAGAPNVVRGGSHSGNVSAQELVEEGLLDALSSDYVPASLLQAVAMLDRRIERELPELFGLVTWRVADMLRLGDRGRLTPGLRADLVRFRFADETPVVAELYAAGRRVM
jgi:alpha-D-ribose 1-methylphosphonate 5-triphosphate diphosphatase